MLLATACRFLAVAMREEQIDVSGVIHESRDGSADCIVSTFTSNHIEHIPARHNRQLTKLATRTQNKCFHAAAALLDTANTNSKVSLSGMCKDAWQLKVVLES